ncbi:putative orfan [Tupanvirus soda lake]|uniref:Orfan n=2 Tax=Tupanvirus TaxID=2094720 RepID=A0AC62AAW3_9VIRU|nr:putative orfan [Tupanvirus soda lake]QKU34785.1 putative orfan [Tupanvirus soda lake]
MSIPSVISAEVQKVFIDKYFLDDIGLAIINEHFKRENITLSIIDDTIYLKFNKNNSVFKLDEHRIIKRLVQLYSTKNEKRSIYPEYLNLINKQSQTPPKLESN